MRDVPLILIVEDNREAREILEARLLANNYEVITAPDGEVGLKLAIKKHPDLIPYVDLTASEKEYDRKMAMDTLKLVISMGYRGRAGL